MLYKWDYLAALLHALSGEGGDLCILPVYNFGSMNVRYSLPQAAAALKCAPGACIPVLRPSGLFWGSYQVLGCFCLADIK